MPKGAPTPSPSHGDQQPLGLEAALGQVEDIVRQIESGEIGLERAIVEYERGVGLIKHCRGILDKAEQRVTDLTAQMQASTEATKPKSKPDPTA